MAYASSAAVAGATPPGGAGPRSATGGGPTTATGMGAFALDCFPVRIVPVRARRRRIGSSVAKRERGGNPPSRSEMVFRAFPCRREAAEIFSVFDQQGPVV